MSIINRRQFLKTVSAGSAAMLGSQTLFCNSPEKKQPNIVFFLIDDMGWMDCGANGSQYYETPNIDRLMASGVRFTDAYAANPLCSPTRASILTGKFPARLGITTPCGHLPAEEPFVQFAPNAAADRKVIEPNPRRYLQLEERTLAEALKTVGYQTGFIGKWHLGHDEKYWPLSQGFDVNIGGGPWPGPPSYHSPYHISTLPDGPESEYITDRLTDEAIHFLDKQVSGGSADLKQNNPFFLCFWQYAVHAPYQHKQEITDTFLDKKDPTGRQNNPVMASMIKSMDESIGRVVDHLDTLGIRDNTLIIFFSDNGGNMYDRVAPWNIPPTNNAPLRLGKGSIYEGGVRVPMAVCWPGQVQAGSLCSEVVTSIDFYPTLLEITGAQTEAGQILDGVSLMPVLSGKGSLEREAIFCHFPHKVGSGSGTLNFPCTSVRKGNWKLIRYYETGESWKDEYELFNLASDIGETTNLAGREPEKVRELSALIDRHIKETGIAVPIPNPAFDPRSLLIIEGWQAGGNAMFELKDQQLWINSQGGDPYFRNATVPKCEGNLKIRIRYQSESSGMGQFFWTTTKNPNFGPAQRLNYSPVHDGKVQENEIEFVADGPLTQIRFDPSAGSGMIRLESIILFDEDNQELHNWDFTTLSKETSQHEQ